MKALAGRSSRVVCLAANGLESGVNSSLENLQRFGPCEVQSLIGSGALGEVYRVRDSRLGREHRSGIVSTMSFAQTVFDHKFCVNAKPRE